MKGVYLVEPAVALYAFSSSLISPLTHQFIYRRLWEDITNSTYPDFTNVSRCANHSSSNGTSYREEVQKQASLLSLYTELFSAIPSFIVTVLLVTYSDRGGRRVTLVAPVIGALLYTTGLLAISYFQLNIYLTIGCSVLRSLFGGFGTFLGGCFAYVVDRSKSDQGRTLRLAGVDMILGVVGGGAALSSGHFLRAAGFDWPFFTSAMGLVLLLLYVAFVLEETVKRVPSDDAILDSHPRGSAIKEMFRSICHVFAGGGWKHKATLIVLFLAFIVFVFADMGSLSLITLYELNKPLCFTEVLIGYSSALGTVKLLVSFFGVMVFSKCRVPQTLIALMGFLSFISGMVTVSFAKTTQIMFLARALLLLCAMPFPVLRSMMSKIISKTEQGALFACLSCMESLMAMVSGAAFSSLYAATVAWFSGFAFLLSAGLCTIPAILIGALIVMRVDFSSKDATTPEDHQSLIHEENNCGEDIN